MPSHDAPPTGSSPPPGGRDRDEHGRAQNARPRDRTGRPLARDTTETRLVVEVDYDSVEEALAWGVARWEQGRFFEAHECLEDVWHATVAQESRFWQGVIQVAVTYVHHQRGNPGGVVATVGKALPKLAHVPDRHHGIDVAGLRDWLTDARTAQRAEPGCDLAPPPLGLGPEGAWLHPTPTTTALGRRGETHRGNLA